MSGGGTKTEYEASPEQRALLSAIQPMISTLAQKGTSMYGQPGMGAPAAPVTDYTYQIPSTQMLMPTQEWYAGIAPEVKAGLMAPYEEVGMQLLEQMGMKGQVGSARGGYSGTAGALMGELGARAAKDIGLQAWQMTQPGLQAGWQAGLGRNIEAYQQALRQQQQDYQAQMMGWQMPLSLAGMAPQLTPTGITTPQGGAAGALGGGLMGGMGGLALGGSIAALNPYMWPLAAAGALGGGLMGGK